MRYRVDSEVGELRQVILHRPGREMTRLTPSNKDELLFDDLLWLAEAQAEHDAFANVLRSEGVEVLYFAELLGETLEDTAARKFALEHAFDERAFGPGLTDALWTLAEGSSGWELADLLIAGITKAELLDRVGTPRSVLIDLMDDDDLVLPPLPNHLFTRDTSAWAYGGVAVNSMRKEARRRETLNFETIYTYHPRFATADFQRWSLGDDDGPAVLEGGDVLVTGNGSVVVGLSERSTPQGAERFARRLFESGEAETVVALNMPAKREMMHLDTVLTMLDEDTFTVYQNLGNLPSVTIRPGASPEKLDITRNEDADMFSVIGAAAGIGDPRVLITPQDSLAAQREQWDDGCNFLAIRPGVVVGYERNVTTNEYLTAQGIDVRAVPGSELGRGRGGPRCMSCPTIRDAAPPQKETSL
ncbi:arginine deiminase [Ruaniaceae bacterium KH17]|nr:arginine deiminase [Ruaniaceae bacterium KH17]